MAKLYFLCPAPFALFSLFLPFINGLCKCTDALYFTGSNYPSTPPLPASHSAQIQKNSFHYCCVTKGHIRQCGMVSVSTDAFCGLTHPLAVKCFRISTCMAPPFLFSCSTPAFGVILLCPNSLFHWMPFPCRPKAFTGLLPVLLSHSKTGSKPSPRRRGAGIEG